MGVEFILLLLISIRVLPIWFSSNVGSLGKLYCSLGKGFIGVYVTYPVYDILSYMHWSE